MHRILSVVALLYFTSATFAVDRPNILWITNEDMGPNLGCYGDAYATTPNLDQFAKQSLRYTKCWSNAPVCAPARTTIITGLYPTSTGAEHMRSLVPMPTGMKMFPEYLRDNDYYCTNNSKEDYNIAPDGKVWDESSPKAHYRNRNGQQSFFAVFNIVTTHESQIRTRPHKAIHDPAKVSLPPYHPDTPEVRQDWAQYYDKITQMDAAVGKLLAELKDEGLADETIVIYFSDHGSGMPRHKRSPQNSGLHVPFMIHFPKNWQSLAPKEYQPGGSGDRLISFVDLAPTMLSLIGVQPPKEMQGVPFLGKFSADPRQYLHGFRGRMDERLDCIRSVRDAQYVYVRNYMPHIPKGQHVGYMFQTPTTRVWKELFDAGKLNEAQSAFFQPKAPEELYDLQNDPFEIKNLATSPEHETILKRFRSEQADQVQRVRDVGLLPEGEMQRRAGNRSPYDFGHSQGYPLSRIQETADWASSLTADALPMLMKRWDDTEPGVRYWVIMGVRMRGKQAVLDASKLLEKSLDDKNASVAVAAAEALVAFGEGDLWKKASLVLMDHANAVVHGPFVPVQAMNAMEPWKLRDDPMFLKLIRKLPEKTANVAPRNNEYVGRLKAYYLGKMLP